MDGKQTSELRGVGIKNKTEPMDEKQTSEIYLQKKTKKYQKKGKTDTKIIVFSVLPFSGCCWNLRVR